MAITKAKAKIILEHGEIRGKPLTAKQKRTFGMIAHAPRKKIRKKKTLLT